MQVNFDLQRSASEEWQALNEKAGAKAIITELMKAVDCLAAVLNGNRRVIAVNDRLFETLNIDDPLGSIGLRAGDFPHGAVSMESSEPCGAGDDCSSCSSAVASVIDKAMRQVEENPGEPVEQLCSLTSAGRGQGRDCFFNVQATSFMIGSERFILLFLRDVTRHQQLEALERVFFHDINNTLSSLVAASELLLNATAGEFRVLAPAIRRLSNRMAQEVSMQRHLIQRYYGNCQLYKQNIQVKLLIDELVEMMSYHPAAAGKPLDIDCTVDQVEIETAPSIVLRVLSNMLVNAFEAADGREAVRFSAHLRDGLVVFEVWNRQFIPRERGRRIFQRNYSTKGEIGRGLGTFSMKLFGEKILGGKVSFSTDPLEGTVFRFALSPRTPELCD